MANFDSSNEYIDVTKRTTTVVLWNEFSQSYEKIEAHKSITVIQL